MRRIELHIEEIAISGAGLEADRVGPVLEEALKIMGERLGASPSRLEEARRVVVEQLQLEIDSVEALLGPSGPSRLADQLLEQLAKETT